MERLSNELFMMPFRTAWGRFPWKNEVLLTESQENELDRLNALYSPESSFLLDATAGTKYLWGTTPPLDILNLPANEGSNYDKALLLNFRGTPVEIFCFVYRY